MNLKTKLDLCPRSSSGAGAHSPFWEAVVVLVCLALEAFLRQPGGSVPGHRELDTRRGGRGFALQAQEDPPCSAAGPRLRGVFSSFPESARGAVLCSLYVLLARTAQTEHVFGIVWRGHTRMSPYSLCCCPEGGGNDRGSSESLFWKPTPRAAPGSQG